MNEKLKPKVFKLSKWIFLLLGFVMLNMNTFAQPLTVSGVVTSAEDGMALPGVSVVKKGTTSGTITNAEGKYTLQAKKGDVLIFSFIGMKIKQIAVGSDKYDVKLESKSIGIEEIVAIGYGGQKRKEVSGAVAQVKSEELQKFATADLGTALQGQIAGVSVQASSGEPGSESNIQIRGITSVTGSNAPLYVVDGVPQEDDPKLSSNEIQTIDVLKDAASASIYGTRGAGGVILITTKSGKAGDMKISYDGYTGIQKITSGIELMDFSEYFYQYFIKQSNLSPGATSDNNWTTLETSPNSFTNNTNIIGNMQNDNAIIQNHSLNISGGLKDLTYSVVGSYYNQDGVLINTGYDRFNVRANTSYNKDRWSVNTGLGFRVEKRSYAPNNFLYEAYKYKPYQNIINVNQESLVTTGPSSNNDATNMGNLAVKFKQSDNQNSEQFNGNLNLKYKILDGLYATTQLSTSYDNRLRVVINPKFDVYAEDGTLVVNTNTRSQIKNTSERRTSFTWESGLNYEKKFGDHKINLLGIFSTEKYTYTQFYADGMDLFSNSTPVLDATTSEYSVGSGNNYTNTLVGMLGRLQYNYKGRYNLSLSARRDGSSKFAKDNRWGVFPSASASWNISDEAFWKSFSSSSNTVKLRLSYGTAGNQNFSPYAFAATVVSGYDYPMGTEAMGVLSYGATQLDFANALVKWETTIQRNIGLDLGFFRNKFTFTADYYVTDKNDMLFPLLLPTSTGGGKNANVTLNIGDMNNKGLELSAGYKSGKKFKWGVSGTFSKNVNKISSMSGTTSISYFTNGYAVNSSDRITAIKEGYAAGSFFVYQTNGLVNTEQKLAEYIKIDPTAKMGDLIYVDNNGNGVIDEDDRIQKGSGSPDFELGLNLNSSYKNFDLSMNWFGSYGNNIVNGSKMYAYYNDTHKDLLYQWSTKNPYGVIPANRGSSSNNFKGTTDIWVEDGSYIRLRNVTLGYTFPKQILSKIGVNKLRIYLASDNPLTLTKYTGYDPEVGNDGLGSRGIDKGNYPISSHYRAGIQLSF